MSAIPREIGGQGVAGGKPTRVADRCSNARLTNLVYFDDGTTGHVDDLTYQQFYAGMRYQHAELVRLCRCNECGVCHWWNQRESALERDRVRHAGPAHRKPVRTEYDRMDRIALRDPLVAKGRK